MAVVSMATCAGLLQTQLLPSGVLPAAHVVTLWSRTPSEVKWLITEALSLAVPWTGRKEFMKLYIAAIHISVPPQSTQGS
jgi:hypothetical protein